MALGPAWASAYDRLPPGLRERGVARLAGMLADEPGAPEGNRHSVVS